MTFTANMPCMEQNLQSLKTVLYINSFFPPPRRWLYDQVGLSIIRSWFCHSMCRIRPYCKSHQPISLGSTNRKNLLTFGGDPVPYTNSGSFFHFPHHYGIEDFRKFINIHAGSGRFSRHLAKSLTLTR